MMDRELVWQSQSEHGETTNGTNPQTAVTTAATTPSSSAPAAPTPPRLTPNPTLLDSPLPTLTPTSSSPPPPLTPAPSLSMSHGPKAAAGAPSPHLLIPTPPKLTLTAGPALRTYSRPILPSPTGVSKTPSSPTTHPPGSSTSSPAVASTASSSVTHGSTTTTAKTSAVLTNGNTRPVSTATSTPITPFHTPASPTGRQVSQAHPLGTPSLVRANQSPSPVRQRVSQQTLLLGKGLKGSGQDQVLLRAQMLILTSAMRPASSSSSCSTSSSSSTPSSHPASAQLQSLTLRPPPPGTLTIPPSLRLKPSSSGPPPLSRPRNPLFPPLRPRPQPSTMATESLTLPTRHLSVPPPTLYSPVRAVPLKPRLHSPNGHRAPPPRHSPSLQPIAAAPASQTPSINRHLAGLTSCPLSQTTLVPGQSHHSSLSMSNPMTPTSHFERSPSAARQLQIIALSSGRQTQSGNNSYTHASVQSAPPVVESPELAVQSQRTLSGEDAPPLPLNSSLPKTTSPLSSPPSLLCPSSPLSQSGPQTNTLIQQGENLGRGKESEEQRERGKVTGLRQGTGDEASIGKDLRVERDDQREREKTKEEKQRLAIEKEENLVSHKEQGLEIVGEEERMEVTEEGQSEREWTQGGEEKKKMMMKKKNEEEEEEEEIAMDQSENLAGQYLHQYQNLEAYPKLGPVAVQDCSPEAKPILGLIPAPVPVLAPNPTPTPVSTSVPVPAPVSTLVPVPIPVSTPVPIPVSTPAPVLAPVSTLVPAPVSTLVPVPAPVSTLVPVPAPVSTLVPVPAPVSTLVPATVPAPVSTLVPVPAPVSTVVPGPAPVSTPVTTPTPELSIPRLSEPHRDLQPVNQEDFCENMSTQSDNQSALSSLSSQSPPSSPFIVPSAENPPPLLPAQPSRPADLSLSQREPEAVGKSQEETEHLGQSEDESVNLNLPQSGPWAPRAWPEGRQVLTHLVEGFVIQEGLQPFPVNRSSLLVPDQVNKPNQEVNGTNGREALPVTDTLQQTEHSTDSDDEEGRDTDGTRSSHRDRAVLHCQFCGKRGHAHNFMRSKRFCSTSCARGFNVRLTKRLRALSAGSRSERPRPALNRAESVPGKPLLLRLPRDLWSAGRREKEGNEEEEEVEAEEEGGRGEDPAVAVTTKMERRAARRARRASEPAMTTSTPTTTFKPGPAQWSVEEVTAFIHTLPGCGDVAEAFRLQEIDGQALLLLTEDHLMTSMNIKLGPALKICAHINTLKNQ